MDVRREVQTSPVADEVQALTAVIPAILLGLLYKIPRDIVAEVGGHENVKLKMLPRMHAASDGDTGICFEYAVHEAVMSGDARVMSRLDDALKLCKIEQGDIRSLLFGFEKTGAVQIIDTAEEELTDDSRVLTGGVGQPPKIKKRLNLLASAFRRPKTRLALPSSIRGLWKADLMIGRPTAERWVGTTVKVNPSQLEGAAGLRIGIIPVRSGQSDKVRRDESKGLIVCPLHHDGDFMQTFHEGVRMVQALIKSNMNMPSEAYIPEPEVRDVARVLVKRREIPVVELVDVLRTFGQPHLLSTVEKSVVLTDLKGEAATSTLLAPKPLMSGE